MATRLELLQEAERRGLLPARERALLVEARARGLLADSQIQGAATPVTPVAGAITAVPEATRARFLGLGLPTEYEPAKAAENLPMLGGMAASGMVPGLGWGAVALRSLAALGGGAAGETGRQAVAGEGFDPATALKVGAQEGAGNLVGEGFLKGLGRLFPRGLSEGQQGAVEFAREKGAPAPLEFLAPSTPGARLAQAGKVTIGGRIRNYSDATRVTQEINRELATIGGSADKLDVASQSAQRVVREVFDERAAITRTMDRFKAAAGVDAEIPIPHLREALPKALQQLSRSGQNRTEPSRVVKQLMRYHGNEAAEGAGFLKPQDIDDLLFVAKPKAGVRRIIQDSLIKDLDAYAKGMGIEGFGDELRGSIKRARETLDLGNSVEGLADLAESAGSAKTITWAKQAMQNPHTREWLRKQNPAAFKDLADSWAANELFRAAKSAGIGEAVNAGAARKWFVDNQSVIKEYLGSAQAKAWDNFTLYLQYMAKAPKAEAPKFGNQALAYLGVAGAQSAGVAVPGVSTGVILASEPAAFVLARSLNNPNGWLFKTFTDGVSPSVRQMWLRAAGVTGQASAKD